MIEPALSLAMSVYQNKGVYALMLGSGLSRSAGVYTGWEVVLDLIRKVAHLRGEDCEPDPAAWYRQVYGSEPDYSQLLAILAKAPPERQQLLRGYFEPTDDEREQGIKVPTMAHHAIAELVARGYVRVIVTTNFDRLIELALEARGVTPTVIASADAAQGALPLAHLRCAVIKLHGDYLDTRILNTAEELGRYPRRMNRLLDQVLDEYGLVVCGWSAEWDTALRAAIERCPTRRFSTYWAARSAPKGVAKQLVECRRGTVVTIADADTFFRKLADDVQALADLTAPEMLPAKVARATVKRYLVDPTQRIRLHDLVVGEAGKIYREIVADGDLLPAEAPSGPKLLELVLKYERISEVLRSMLASACYWGAGEHERTWTATMERLARLPEAYGYKAWASLRLYPALLAMFAGGMAAVANDRYGNLAAILLRPQVVTPPHGEMQPILQAVNTTWVIEKDVAKLLPGMENHYVPLSDYLFGHPSLWEAVREVVPDDDQFTRVFDRLQYLVALIHTDMRAQMGWNKWGPEGCFAWRDRHRPDGIAKVIEREVAGQGSDWPPLRAGFFGGEVGRYQEAATALQEYVGRLGIW